MDSTSYNSDMTFGSIAIMSNCACATTSMVAAKMPLGTYTIAKTQFTAIIGDDP